MNGEKWQQIKIENVYIDYEVSIYGRIRRIKTGLILSPGESGKGYLRVQLTINKIPRGYSVHRLVALAFIPNSENKPQVNHKDGDKHNNNVTNLEWVTQSENINHAILNGLMISPGKGVEGRNTKNTEEDVHKVCKMLEKSVSIKKIAKKLNVTEAFIIGIKYNNNWEDIRSKYNIPDNKPYGERTKEQIKMIDDIISLGTRSKKDILKMVGLPDTKTHRRYVKYRIAKMVECSTTIENFQNHQELNNIEENVIFGYELEGSRVPPEANAGS